MSSGEENEENEYEVERILKATVDWKRGKQIRWKYYVKWKGYDEEDDNTWEPAESFKENFGIIRRFWRTVDTEDRLVTDGSKFELGETLIPDPNQVSSDSDSSGPSRKPAKGAASGSSRDKHRASEVRNKHKARSETSDEDNDRPRSSKQKGKEIRRLEQFKKYSSGTIFPQKRKRVAVLDSDEEDEPAVRYNSGDNQSPRKRKLRKSPKPEDRLDSGQEDRSSQKAKVSALSGLKFKRRTVEDFASQPRRWLTTQQYLEEHKAGQSSTQTPTQTTVLPPVEHSRPASPTGSLFSEPGSPERKKQQPIQPTASSVAAAFNGPSSTSVPKPMPPVPAHRAPPRVKLVDQHTNVKSAIKQRILNKKESMHLPAEAPNPDGMVPGSDTPRASGPSTASVSTPRPVASASFSERTRDPRPGARKSSLLTFSNGGLVSIKGQYIPPPVMDLPTAPVPPRLPADVSGVATAPMTPLDLVERMSAHSLEPVQETPVEYANGMASGIPGFGNPNHDIQMTDTSAHNAMSGSSLTPSFPAANTEETTNWGDSAPWGTDTYSEWGSGPTQWGDVQPQQPNAVVAQPAEVPAIEPPNPTTLLTLAGLKDNQDDLPDFEAEDEIEELAGPSRRAESEAEASSSAEDVPKPKRPAISHDPVPIQPETPPTIALEVHNDLVIPLTLLQIISPPAVASKVIPLLEMPIDHVPGKIYPADVADALKPSGFVAKLGIDLHATENQAASFRRFRLCILGRKVFITKFKEDIHLALCHSRCLDVGKRLKFPENFLGIPDTVIVAYVEIKDQEQFEEHTLEANEVGAEV